MLKFNSKKKKKKPTLTPRMYFKKYSGSLKLCFSVTFNSIIRHIFPENLIEIFEKLPINSIKELILHINQILLN